MSASWRLRIVTGSQGLQSNLREFSKKHLTAFLFLYFINIDESRNHPSQTRQTRRRLPVLRRNCSRLFAPSLHPPSHRLCRLCRRQGPSSLDFDSRVSRRPHPTVQPAPRTETDRGTVVAQLSPAQAILGAHL